MELTDIICTVPIPDEVRDTWLDELAPPPSSRASELILPPPPRWEDEIEVDAW
ncbi:MAG: hypothetical protein R3B13_35965 [Polyangiaceae bacterium]